jgi:hypothetical protein
LRGVTKSFLAVADVLMHLNPPGLNINVVDMRLALGEPRPAAGT